MTKETLFESTDGTLILFFFFFPFDKYVSSGYRNCGGYLGSELEKGEWALSICLQEVHAKALWGKKEW